MEAWDIFLQMKDGMTETVKIFFLTLIFTLPLGLLVAFGRMSKNFIIRNLTKFYIELCGIFCRDLPIGDRIHAGRPV